MSCEGPVWSGAAGKEEVWIVREAVSVSAHVPQKEKYNTRLCYIFEKA